MISIPRSLARQLRAVFRRAGIRKTAGTIEPLVSFEGIDCGLRIQALSDNSAASYFQHGTFEPERLVLPLDTLADFEGRGHDLVELETQGKNQLLARWTDKGIPQIVQLQIATTKDLPGFPAIPQAWSTFEPELLKALADACQVAAREPTRYALNTLQLRGEQGEVVATDGRHVLRQSCFEFLWADNLLIPACGVFSCSELSKQEHVSIGQTDDWVALQAGPWTIYLRIEKEGRFPLVDDVTPPASQAASRLRLHPADAEFLQKTLPKLPAGDSEHSAVTMELDGQAAFRTRGEEDTVPTELVLSNSTTTGEPIRVNFNRQYLVRALKLGFREVCLFGERRPALCDDGRRQYVWALLEPEPSIAASSKPRRTHSPAAGNGRPVAQSTTKQPRKAKARCNVPESKSAATGKTHRRTKPVPATNATDPAATETVANPIAQVESLRGTLRQALGQTNELIRALKGQQKQAKVVQSALASLKQLQSQAG